MIAGRPMMSSAFSASTSEWASSERGVSSPIRSIASRNSSRSSALSIAVGLGADHLDAELVEDAHLARATARVLSAVWPPMVGSSTSCRPAARRAPSR